MESIAQTYYMQNFNILAGLSSWAISLSLLLVPKKAFLTMRSKYWYKNFLNNYDSLSYLVQSQTYSY